MPAAGRRSPRWRLIVGIAAPRNRSRGGCRRRHVRAVAHAQSTARSTGRSGSASASGRSSRRASSTAGRSPGRGDTERDFFSGSFACRTTRPAGSSRSSTATRSTDGSTSTPSTGTSRPRTITAQVPSVSWSSCRRCAAGEDSAQCGGHRARVLARSPDTRAWPRRGRLFYEIDPIVVHLAEHPGYFGIPSICSWTGAGCRIVLGDARVRPRESAPIAAMDPHPRRVQLGRDSDGPSSRARRRAFAARRSSPRGVSSRSTSRTTTSTSTRSFREILAGDADSEGLAIARRSPPVSRDGR